MTSVICCRVLLLLLSIIPATAATLPAVKVSWNPNPENNIAGYVVSYGTESGEYPTTIDAGDVTRTRVSGLQENVTYYFVVRAYNRAGIWSLPSNEVRYRGSLPDANGAPDSLILSPSTDGTIVAGQSLDFSGQGNDPDNDKNLSYRWSFGNGSGLADSTAANPGDVRFNTPGTYKVTLTVTDPKGLSDPTPATRTITVLNAWSIVPRSSWTLKFVNSEERNGYAATRSFDGDPKTFWHTRWTAGSLPPPHQIQINLGKTHLVKGFQYLPRQDGVTVGDIGRYEFYVSKDGVNWGKPVAAGSFTASSTEKRVFSKPKKGRFIRLVSLAEANGNNDCNVAELNILEGPPANRAPVAASGKLATRKNTRAAVTLKGSDADGNPLTYQIVAAPKHGKLTGSPPNLTYKPDSNFTGSDRFTFRVLDGLAKSKAATVTIRVNAAATKSALVAAAAGSLSEAAGFPSSPVTGTVLIDGEKYLTLTVAKPAGTDGLKRTVQVSSNLVDWFSGKNHTTVLTDNERCLKVRDNTPLAAGRKRHIRLKPLSR